MWITLTVIIPSKKKKKLLRKDVEVEAEIMSTPLTVMAPAKANAGKGGFVWTPFNCTDSIKNQTHSSPQSTMVSSTAKLSSTPKPGLAAAAGKPSWPLCWGLGCCWGTSADNLFQSKPTSVFKNDKKTYRKQQLKKIKK